MGCGCSAGSSGGSSVSAAPSPYRVLQQPTNDNSPCSYTIEQVNIWLEKVHCVKNGGFYAEIPNVTRKQMNIYIGILMSAQNYKDNICYFRRELEEIENFITVVTSKNLCLTN